MEYDILYSMEPTQEQKAEHSRLQKLREEERALRRAVKERISTALSGAFGLIAALAWNDAVKSLLDYLYPASKGGDIWPKFLYAIIVTLIVSVAVYILTKIFADREKKEGGK
jgi:uncharacterized membrane protein YccC